MTAYLKSVNDVWKYILLDRLDLFSALDFYTVSKLQSRNPRNSVEDRVLVESITINQALFPRILEPDIRAAIKERLLEVPYNIPTIGTFLEDTKWLEPCAIIVRKQLLPKAKGSTLVQLYKGFRFPTAGLIERDDGTNLSFTATRDIIFKIAYRQLYAFAWRYFPELSCILPKKDKQKSKPSAKAYNGVLSMQFMRFAHSLGFDTPLIPREGPETLMIQKFLLEIRPPELFTIGPQQQQDMIASIYSCIANGYLGSRPSGLPEVSQDLQSQITGPTRCGRPSQSSHGHAKTRFFYLNIYGTATPEPNLFNNACIFKLFFGQDSLQSSYSLSSGDSRMSGTQIAASNGSETIANSTQRGNGDITTERRASSRTQNTQRRPANHDTRKQLTMTKAKSGSSSRRRKVVLIDFDTRRAREVGVDDAKKEVMLLKSCKFAIITESPNHGSNLKFLQPSQAQRVVKKGDFLMYCKIESDDRMQKDWENIYNQLIDENGLMDLRGT